MQTLFTLSGERLFGKGGVQSAWSPSGALLAVCGSNGAARVFDRAGSQVAELQLDARAACLAVDWDHSGEVRSWAGRGGRGARAGARARVAQSRTP